MRGPQTIRRPWLSCTRHTLVARIVTVVVGALVFGGCSTQRNIDRVAYSGQRPNGASNDAMIQCVLPGQIRQLGNKLTYLSAPRVIKTSVRDCEIRGGSQEQQPIASASAE